LPRFSLARQDVCLLTFGYREFMLWMRSPQANSNHMHK
jgi:hypothetical protein